MDDGILYVVSTPIGNLEDITLRAVRILKEVDLIAAEDTRRTRKLLSHFDIHTPITSYHEHNERAKATRIADRIENGQSVALVSDAGTPAVSDPGYHIINESIRRGIAVVPVPGPDAFSAALVGSGLPGNEFVFGGFLPRKQGRLRACLEALGTEKRTTIFYESPHRLLKTLGLLAELYPERRVAIGRELTKRHEEFIRGTAQSVYETVRDTQVRGEFVLVIGGAGKAKPEAT